MSAITISRQMGSRGDELALEVARRLGWRRVCRDIINQAALAAGVPQVALAEMDELGLLGLRPTARERRLYLSQVERIIRELADAGNVVIVGRGSQLILRERPDVLHVRVIAPLEARVTWLCQAESICREAARVRLEASDQARARYLQRNYRARVGDPSLYHLVINTGRLTLPVAVDLVLHTFQTWRATPLSTSNAMLC